MEEIEEEYAELAIAAATETVMHFAGPQAVVRNVEPTQLDSECDRACFVGQMTRWWFHAVFGRVAVLFVILSFHFEIARSQIQILNFTFSI